VVQDVDLGEDVGLVEDVDPGVDVDDQHQHQHDDCTQTATVI